MNRTGKVYSPKTLADELKVSIRVILRAILSGELATVKFSTSMFRIEGADVDRWIESLKK